MCISDLPGWTSQQAAATRRATLRARADMAAAATARARGEVSKADYLPTDFARSFVSNGGLVVHGGGWTDQSAAELVRVLLQALKDGLSSDKAAAQLRGYDGLDSEVVVELRMTEINRANGEAYLAGAAGTPGVVGFRFLLSPRHPKPDICDLLATQNLYGLGAGVYPTRELLPWPPHPGALAFVVSVFDDEVTAEARTGKETTLQALMRLSPHEREGVLGPIKAKYLDQALLRSWMIRSPLAAVQARLVRQGRLDQNALESDPDPWADDTAEDA